MNWMFWSALLTATCTWGTGWIASAAERGEKTVETEVIRDGGGHTLVIASEGEGEGDVRCIGNVRVDVELKSDADGKMHVIRGMGAGEPHRVLFAADGDREPVRLISTDEDDDSGWLGVQLSSQTNGEHDASGVVVTNVAKDSAAAAAGFEKDDVILEVDDVAVDDDLGALVEKVRAGGAGERMKFTILRDGQKKLLVATLGRRGDVQDVVWQYENDARMLLHDELRAKAKVLLKDDNGEWHFESLGDNIDLKALPDDISKMLPGFHSRSLNVVIENDAEKHVAITINRDGEQIGIETTDDGGIQVTRTNTETDEETVTTYANEDELAAGDEEAFEVFSLSGNHFVFDVDGEGHGEKTFSFSFDDDGPHAVWLEKMEAELAEESDALTNAMDRLKNIHIDVDVPDADVKGGSGSTFFEFIRGKARQTIRENPDGTIDVITRKGDNELVKRYADEIDLQERNPDAYKTFLDLQDDGD